LRIDDYIAQTCQGGHDASRSVARFGDVRDTRHIDDPDLRAQTFQSLHFVVRCSNSRKRNYIRSTLK
jgi:hypothetical protein